MTVADRIKEQREKLGMSQEELAHNNPKIRMKRHG